MPPTPLIKMMPPLAERICRLSIWSLTKEMDTEYRGCTAPPSANRAKANGQMPERLAAKGTRAPAAAAAAARPSSIRRRSRRSDSLPMGSSTAKPPAISMPTNMELSVAEWPTERPNTAVSHIRAPKAIPCTKTAAVPRGDVRTNRPSCRRSVNSMGGAAMALSKTGIMAMERTTDARMNGWNPPGGHRVTVNWPAMKPSAMTNM